MKNYTITVNGNVYEVTVEEGTGSVSAPVAAAKAPAAPKAPLAYSPRAQSDRERRDNSKHDCADNNTGSVPARETGNKALRLSLFL